MQTNNNTPQANTNSKTSASPQRPPLHKLATNPPPAANAFSVSAAAAAAMSSSSSSTLYKPASQSQLFKPRPPSASYRPATAKSFTNPVSAASARTAASAAPSMAPPSSDIGRYDGGFEHDSESGIPVKGESAEVLAIDSSSPTCVLSSTNFLPILCEKQTR
jgi:hypothetical protein